MVADALGWQFFDFDEVIEADTGLAVPEIFNRYGEARFRTLEASAGEKLLAMENVVLGSGGGWAAAPGRVSDVPKGTVAVWLQVSPEESVRRTSREVNHRPLLVGENVLERARALLEERSVFYAAAPWTVDTEQHSVEDVSARILEILAEIGPPKRTE